MTATADPRPDGPSVEDLTTYVSQLQSVLTMSAGMIAAALDLAPSHDVTPDDRTVELQDVVRAQLDDTGRAALSELLDQTEGSAVTARHEFDVLARCLLGVVFGLRPDLYAYVRGGEWDDSFGGAS